MILTTAKINTFTECLTLDSHVIFENKSCCIPAVFSVSDWQLKLKANPSLLIPQCNWGFTGLTESGQV